MIIPILFNIIQTIAARRRPLSSAATPAAVCFARFPVAAAGSVYCSCSNPPTLLLFHYNTSRQDLKLLSMDLSAQIQQTAECAGIFPTISVEE